jgi:hypothetical protein
MKNGVLRSEGENLGNAVGAAPSDSHFNVIQNG